jgi:hypothetical protein
MDCISILPTAQNHINGLNLYAYCLNDPVNYFDPTGQWRWLRNFFRSTVGQVVTGVALTFGLGVASLFVPALMPLAMKTTFGALTFTLANGLTNVLSGRNFSENWTNAFMLGAVGGLIPINGFLGGAVAGMGLYAFDAWVNHRRVILDGLIVASIFGGIGGHINPGLGMILLGIGLGIAENWANANFRPIETFLIAARQFGEQFTKWIRDVLFPW